MAAGVSKCLRGAVWRKGTNRPFPPGCAQSTDFSGNPEDEWAQKPQKTHETHKSCSEAAPELLFGSRQTKLAEACRPSSSENGGFASVLPQLWVLSSDHRGQSFETIPGVSEQAKSPQTMDRDPLKSPPSHTAGRGCGSGGLTPISPHQLPPQKNPIFICAWGCVPTWTTALCHIPEQNYSSMLLWRIFTALSGFILWKTQCDYII